MSELTKKLRYIKSGSTTEETCSLYSTTDECPEPYLSFTVDGANAYAKLGDVDDANASDIRVYRNSDSKTYAVLKSALVNVTITQSANQTIHVYTPQKDGGTDHTESFTIPIGTSYEAEVIADDGYTAGTLNVTGGVNNKFTIDTAFSANEASDIPTGKDYLGMFNNFNVSTNPPTMAAFLENLPDLFTFVEPLTIPARVKVIKVSWNIYTMYVGVTPGKQYRAVGAITEYRRNTSIKWCNLLSSTTIWMSVENDSADFVELPVVSWSPEINNQTPEVTDY